MMKMAWGLLNSGKDFWVKIIHDKYLPNGDVPNSQGVGQTSRLWRGICNIWNVMGKGIGWVLGDGKWVRF